MKLKINAILALLALAVAFSAPASAITLTQSDLIGKVADGTPSGDSHEIARLQNFINYFNDGTAFPADGQTYTPNGSWTNLPDVDDLEYKEEDKPVLPHNITESYTYLMAKYGQGQTSYSIYFYLGGQTGSLTEIFNYGGGLSHVSLFNKTTTSVPDGGTTAALLGLGLVGMSIAARRRSV